MGLLFGLTFGDAVILAPFTAAAVYKVVRAVRLRRLESKTQEEGEEETSNETSNVPWTRLRTSSPASTTPHVHGDQYTCEENSDMCSSREFETMDSTSTIDQCIRLG